MCGHKVLYGLGGLGFRNYAEPDGQQNRNGASKKGRGVVGLGLGCKRQVAAYHYLQAHEK